ncbi:SEC-C domain-containing protein [Pelotomaculum isophthalicicum JI]|uniref:SEC-C domain-containing protein n=1 Tax=Pelotomaculum isophthalicicum JI TaxID=947010 RepID=A0A9X4H6L9_9FIRM|nr:SEC-C metal-binding domain-containing protein [Pelotomaculum isophthalicicum]MDF9408579.1 SEC-C domain-containing protein [Pelotomaculum isophthalicicum JI]
MPRTKKSCPCGSGKPYEKCCGESKACCSLDQVRWRRAGQELRRKLGEFADQPSFAWDAARAQDMYLGCMDQRLMLHDDDFTMERCFEWFIFDFYISRGSTIIETFREEYSHPLSNYENVLVKEWSRSRISLYEVQMVLPGKGLVIKDLLSRKKLVVHDINAAAEIKSGSILLMRVLKVGDEYEFSTSGLALPDWCKEPLLRRLYQDREDYYNNKMKGVRGWGTYLKERSHKINAWVMELGTDNTWFNSESAGMKREQYKIKLPLKDWRELIKHIKCSDEFVITQELRDRTGVCGVLAAWLGESRSIKGLRRVLGNIVLTPRSIVITAGSPKTLSAGKKLFINGFKEFIEDSAEEISYQADVTAEAVAETFPWPEPGYAVVAVSVKEGLAARGYNIEQQRAAAKLWFDYCSKEQPSIRKTAVWAAAVIYAFTRLEKEEELKQQDLAGQYGVASSTISSKYRLLCQSLELVTYDERYSTKGPPLKRLRGNRGEHP